MYNKSEIYRENIQNLLGLPVFDNTNRQSSIKMNTTNQIFFKDVYLHCPICNQILNIAWSIFNQPSTSTALPYSKRWKLSLHPSLLRNSSIMVLKCQSDLKFSRDSKVFYSLLVFYYNNQWTNKLRMSNPKWMAGIFPLVNSHLFWAMCSWTWFGSRVVC